MIQIGSIFWVAAYGNAKRFSGCLVQVRLLEVLDKALKLKQVEVRICVYAQAIQADPVWLNTGEAPPDKTGMQSANFSRAISRAFAAYRNGKPVLSHRDNLHSYSALTFSPSETASKSRILYPRSFERS